MHYEINVSHKGFHLFATAPRSCVSEEDVRKVYFKLRAAFPTPDYLITVTFYPGAGADVTDKFAAEYLANLI